MAVAVTACTSRRSHIQIQTNEFIKMKIELNDDDKKDAS